MDSLGIEMARSEVAYSVDEALAIADKLGYPVVLRPAYTMGGAGGGLVYNVEELKTVCARGLQASLVGQVLVEESILGWEELELEVVRDAEGNMITVCFIENIDPLGVHTGDSFCSAPMLTISEEVQKRLQEKSYKIVDAIQVIGGTNVQWAHDPETDRDHRHRNQPQNLPFLRTGFQGNRLPHCSGFRHAGNRSDSGRDPLRQIRHTG